MQWCVKNHIILDRVIMALNDAKEILKKLSTLLKNCQSRTMGLALILNYGDKPLAEPMLTKFCDTVWRHWATRS